MKNNYGERKSLQSDYSGEEKFHEEECELEENKEDNVSISGKTYFGSDPKEGHRLDLKSPFEPYNEY